MKLRGTHNNYHALEEFKGISLTAIKRKYKPVWVHYGDVL
jgi:hypothetical protein